MYGEMKVSLKDGKSVFQCGRCCGVGEVSRAESGPGENTIVSLIWPPAIVDSTFEASVLWSDI